MIKRRDFIKGVAASAVAACHGGMMASPASAAENAGSHPPNIVFILSDDVGYGDLGCYGAMHVKTPCLDRLARDGVRFTDAHSTAAVCTPTRYSFLTGQYAWRNRAGDHILSGLAPLSIAPTMVTVPSLLRQAGYATGLVGKWHLGLGTAENPVDYNQDIAPGPPDVGFDYAFFYPATNDRVPCVYVEDRRVVGLDPADPIRVSYEANVGDDPTGKDHPELLKMKADASHSQTIVNGISRIGSMAGGKAARWVDEDMADTLTGKAIAFIEQNKGRQFFLYFAPHDIHEPMAPNARFRGTSDCGTRGDALHELDWCVGAILAALERLGLADDTLLVFASDNGGAIKNTYDDGTNALHSRQPPNGPLRGDKGALYEGGHRVPFLARWPGRIKPDTTSGALIGLVDMMATFAAVTGVSLPGDAGPDSFNVLPALLDEKRASPVRDHLVLQSNGANALALRQGPWKLIPKSKRGGPQAGQMTAAELYNLVDDLAETVDLSGKHLDKVGTLGGTLLRLRTGVRSRP